jgi:hypothetical protein
VTVPALTVNVPEAEPWGMLRLDGKVASAGDELRATLTALGALLVNSTVHVAVEGGVSDTELQENPLRPSGVIVTVPPVTVVASMEPPASAESGLESCKVEDVSVVVLDKANAMVATTPVPIVVAFDPDNTQITEPAPGTQSTDLLAAVAAGPAETVAEEKSAVE